MNILPKKSWHVRTRDNIERVKRDEANAAEEEKRKEARIALAEQEARTELLRIKARGKQPVGHAATQLPAPQPAPAATTGADAPQPQLLTGGHINFFADIESGSKTQKSNKDHEAEKKREQDAYEKKIGLLVGLGQSALESQTEKPWYQQCSRQQEEEKTGTKDTDTYDLKRKNTLDPMNAMLRYLGKKPKKAEGSKTTLTPSRDEPSKAAGGLPGDTSLLSMFSKHKRKVEAAMIDAAKDQPSERATEKKKKKRTKKHKSVKTSKRYRKRKDRKESAHRRKSRHKSDSESGSSDSDYRHKVSRQHRTSRRKHKRRRSKHQMQSSSSSDSESNTATTGSGSAQSETPSATKSKPRPTMEQLRAERIRREATEKTRTARLLAGKPLEDQAPVQPQITDKLDGKYNSQFNPHLARKRQPKEPLF